MQFSWGGFSQPCSVTSPSTPNPLGMCAGKCVCGPVCITTVPTIHHLLGTVHPNHKPVSYSTRPFCSLGVQILLNYLNYDANNNLFPEPTTPPISTRRKRRDSTGGLAGFTSESESPPTPPMSQSPSTASTPIASVLPRFRNKG